MKTIRTGLLSAGLLVGMGIAPVLAADDYAEFDKPGPVDSKVAEGLITGSRVGLIVAALEKAGFEVEVNKDSKDAPLIASTDKDVPFSVHFYDCSDGVDCGTIQFVNGWNMENGTTAVTIERWNADKIWGQAYRDSDKDPWLGLTVNLRGGVTPENFADTVEIWSSTLQNFQEHIGWNDE